VSAVNYKSVGGDMAIEATLTAWAEVTNDTSIEVVVEAPTSEKRATQCGSAGTAASRWLRINGTFIPRCGGARDRRSIDAG
jgi:acylphosphatase